MEKIVDLLDLYDPTTGDDSTLYTKFVSPTRIDHFVVFVEKLLSLPECLKRDKLTQILSDCLYGGDRLSKLLHLALFSNCDTIITGKFVNILLSIPELISSLFGQNFPLEFRIETYIPRLCRVIRQIVEEDLSARQLLSNWIFALVGRLCLKQYTEIVWNELVSFVLYEAKSDPKWCEICRWMLVGRASNQSTLDESMFVEPILKMLLEKSSCHQPISAILDYSYLESLQTGTKSYWFSKIQFLTTNKFLLIHSTIPESSTIPDAFVWNLFSYLQSSGQQWFQTAVDNLLDTWSNSNAFKFRSYLQHFYLCRLMIVAVKFVCNFQVNQKLIEKFRKIVYCGVEIHLRSSQLEFRAIGLTTTHFLLEEMGKFQGLQLEIPKFDEEIQPENQNDCSYLQQLASIDAKQYYEAMSVIHKPTVEVKGEVEEVRTKIERPKPELDSDDDEEDLIPYDMSNDIDVEDDIRYRGKEIEVNKQDRPENVQDILLVDNSKTMPVHLQDCLDGLMDYEKPLWMERCLRSCERIVISNSNQPRSNTLDNYALRLAQILFHLDDKNLIENFDQLRMRSLVAVCVGSPKIVATYLSQQFYAPHLSIRNRLDVLAVLTSASEKLASIRPVESSAVCEKKEPLKFLEADSRQSHQFELQYFGAEEDSDDDEEEEKEDWKSVVENRIRSKTRFTSREYLKRQNESTVLATNRFVPVAGCFFFPLVRDPNKTEIQLNLREEDCFVLEHLFLALGILVQNCANHSFVKLMAKELIEFLLSFRNHEHR